jgi:hypothetical protein
MKRLIDVGGTFIRIMSDAERREFDACAAAHPCPYCGGRGETRELSHHDDPWSHTVGVRCEHCPTWAGVAEGTPFPTFADDPDDDSPVWMLVGSQLVEGHLVKEGTNGH